MTWASLEPESCISRNRGKLPRNWHWSPSGASHLHKGPSFSSVAGPHGLWLVDRGVTQDLPAHCPIMTGIPLPSPCGETPAMALSRGTPYGDTGVGVSFPAVAREVSGPGPESGPSQALALAGSHAHVIPLVRSTECIRCLPEVTHPPSGRVSPQFMPTQPHMHWTSVPVHSRARRSPRVRWSRASIP